MRHMMRITPKIEGFINAIVEGVTAEEAYRQNFNCDRFERHTVQRRAQELRTDGEVMAEIELRLKAARDQSIRTVADVTNEFLRVAFADTGDIIQHRRLCCRYCHGVNHRYQWKDAGEFNAALQEAEQRNETRKRMRPPLPPLALPDFEGGWGFAFNAPPHAGCPECRGEGKPDLFIADTTKLSAEQRRLIQSVKVGKDGSVEIKFRNQHESLKAAGQMLGGFKNVVVLQNPDGSNVNTAPSVLTLTPEAAQDAYQRWMNGENKE
jgi:phage terminase small subunit